MNNLIRLTLAFGAGMIALPALAAEPTPLSADASAYHAAAAASRPQIAGVRAAQPEGGAASALAQPKTMGSATYPGTPMANAFRAYPPSCAADPLPDKASGSTWSGRVPLFASNTANQAFTETVTVTVWRLACSSSGLVTRYNPTGAYNAMTLMRVDRDAANEGVRTRWPYFPQIQAAQGGIGFTDAKSLVRVASEPNTVISEFSYGIPILDSTTFVLENYPYDGAGYFTFSDAFTLRVQPYLQGVAPLDINIPAYTPTSSTYPDAFAPLPLDGYAAAQWVHGDDGLLVQVTEQYDSSGRMTRQLVFDLLVEDNNGNPLWLVGNAPFPVDATSLTINAIYLGPGLTHVPWGKLKFVVANCNELDVTFAPNPGLPASVPAFTGTTTFNRLFNANGMVCE